MQIFSIYFQWKSKSSANYESNIDGGYIESAEVRMGKGHGEIAKHYTQRSKDVNWKKSKFICTKKGFQQRKTLGTLVF